MSRREKQLQQLLRAERELREALLLHLGEVAARHNTAFFSTDQPWASRDGIAILAEARRILRLSEHLKEQAPISAGVVRAFDQAQNMTNPHRLGPIRLAAELRAEIEKL